MDPDRALAELHRHQDLISAAINDAAPLFEARTAAPGDLARRRWELVRLLRAYQLFKHGELFNPMIRAGDPRQRFEAADLKARCVEIGEAFAAHVRLWSSADIAAAWPDYARAALAISGRIAAHLRHERPACARLLAGTPRRVRMDLRSADAANRG